ncbi:MAG TPA: hypothetical protein VGN63_16770 [Flavisolibacter sp.]|jgi:hypothetical protein|nr:hypothetical protein [Flavisolibacter sp.]
MKRISFQASRKKLIILWFSFSAAVFLIFLIQTMTGRYATNNGEAWEWLFSFLTPSLTLMIGVVIADVMQSSPDVEIDAFFYKLAFFVSLFFLLLLFLAPILVPLLHRSQNKNLSINEQKSIIEAFKSYNNFLLPLQGITMVALGLFFSKK